MHTTRIRACTNSDSHCRQESDHDYNTLYVAHNTTRLPARRRDALSGSLLCPPHSFFATPSSITSAEPSRRQFALPWSRYHPMSTKSSPAIGCSPSANPSADTIRRCTRKRCRGEAEPHARPVSMLPDVGQFTRPPSATGSISSDLHPLWLPNIAQTSRRDLKPASRMAVNCFIAEISCQTSCRFRVPTPRCSRRVARGRCGSSPFQSTLHVML